MLLVALLLVGCGDDDASSSDAADRAVSQTRVETKPEPEPETATSITVTAATHACLADVRFVRLAGLTGAAEAWQRTDEHRAILAISDGTPLAGMIDELRTQGELAQQVPNFTPPVVFAGNGANSAEALACLTE
ncbi:MAG: hypothetical protein JWM90_140 [Thermoleophilia bacterium]|nr:hypothetical protein [Thermoleophilia bacterium]